MFIYTHRYLTYILNCSIIYLQYCVSFRCTIKWFSYICVCALSRVQLFVIPWLQPAISSVHGIFQARILECVFISYSGGSFWHMDRTRVSCTGLPLHRLGSPQFYGRLYCLTDLLSEPLGKPIYLYLYILFQIIFHCRILHDIEYSSLCHTGLCSLSLFYTKKWQCWS